MGLRISLLVFTSFHRHKTHKYVFKFINTVYTKSVLCYRVVLFMNTPICGTLYEVLSPNILSIDLPAYLPTYLALSVCLPSRPGRSHLLKWPHICFKVRICGNCLQPWGETLAIGREDEWYTTTSVLDKFNYLSGSEGSLVLFSWSLHTMMLPNILAVLIFKLSIWTSTCRYERARTMVYKWMGN